MWEVMFWSVVILLLFVSFYWLGENVILVLFYVLLVFVIWWFLRFMLVLFVGVLGVIVVIGLSVLMVSWFVNV